MSKKEEPLEALKAYVPEGSFEQTCKYLRRYRVHLTITRERVSVLGSYRSAFNSQNHRITVNGNLNEYSFLITLIHELAHLLTFEKFGARIAPHGPEWKRQYSQLLGVYINQGVFPDDVAEELIATMQNPSATSCAETSLLRVLRRYDPHKPGFYLLEELPEQSMFKTRNGVLFRKLHQKRKRILCNQEETSRLYLFSPVTEVQLVRKK